MLQVHALLSHEDCKCDPASFAQSLWLSSCHPSTKRSQLSPIQQSVLNQAACESLEGVWVPKLTVRSWNVLKITIKSCLQSGLSLLGRCWETPKRGWSLSWLLSSDPLDRAKQWFIFMLFVLCNWSVISYGAVGVVLTSPHERAIPDVWGCCYCFSLQNYGCGILLSPERHLLERCVLESRGTAVDSTFLKISF